MLTKLGQITSLGRLLTIPSEIVTGPIYLVKFILQEAKFLTHSELLTRFDEIHTILS